MPEIPETDMLMMLAIGTEAVPILQRRDQQEFNRTTKLPIKGSHDPESIASPIKWGKRDSDPGALFREATLPEGWTKKGTSHDMWSHLVDEKGRKRAEIFYKSAFWDPDAFIRFTRRFFATSHYNDDESVTYQVIDCGQGEGNQVVYAETPVLPNRETDGEAHYKAQEAARERAAAWLAERYPDHKNPNAYWDPTP